MACNAPDENFEWADVLSTVEFKHMKKAMQPPPSSYGIKKYTPPTQKYMDLQKEMKEMKEIQERQEKQKAAEPLRSMDVPAASTSKTLNLPSRQSDRLKKWDSGHLPSTERSTK
ncbi:hypothetical protein AZE42_13780 [Rhizopogon vesiculosus]|uniref:Uncharacterized protein n=1 Tax=Rhizopogon vesiculosus TaxID=180088 RepID=A0A1J8PQC6_9AGAM|nr:hypothetical protein AZE42_13780 [Rhizopogon vesiculosus]